ncbi:MAG: S-layer homology domain-containing protein, partial [Bacilli bacterium]|nr:S-layer homology domain-containing protein [Bacilli bacterium]
MKNTIISILTILIISLSSSVFAFSDVEDHWAKDSINNYSSHNLIKGYEDGT